MIKFNVSGFCVYITFGFLFTVSILILLDSPSVKFAAITACAIHELGHCFAAVILDVKFSFIKLWAGGVNIRLKSEMISYKKELAVLISGPLFNIIFYAAYMLNGMNDAAMINLMLALFNLLPYSSLDGGCIVRAFFEYKEKNGLLIQRSAAVITGVIIIVLGSVNFPENILIQSTVLILIADEFAG